MHHKNLEEYLDGIEAQRALLRESNIPGDDTPLIIEKLMVSQESKDSNERIPTISVEELCIDQNGIIGDRHHEPYVPSNARYGYVYKKDTLIPQERHIFAGTNHMSEIISEKVEKDISPSLLGWNMVLSRADGEPVYLDGLPIGTDFTVYPEDVVDTRDKTKMVVNMKLVTFQGGCWVTGKSIAQSFGEPELQKEFIQASPKFRGALLGIHGPIGESILQTKQKVFIRIPTGYVI